MENEIKDRYPQSIDKILSLINSENTNNYPGHLGEGNAITFKSEDSIIPPMLMSHRMFGHIVGLRLKLDDDIDKIRMANEIRPQIFKCLDYESFKPKNEKSFQVASLDIVTENFKTQNNNEKHTYQPQLPYNGCFGVFCCSEDSYDDEYYWLLVKCHSGRVGRQLYNKFFRNNKDVTVKDFKNSPEYLGTKAYSRQLSRALLMNLLLKLGLNDRVDNDLYDEMDIDHVKDDTPTNIQTIRPHIDITFNEFQECTFYNECYNSSNVIGPHCIFFSDTLHNGLMFKRESNILMPVNGNFYANDAALKLSTKLSKRIEEKDYIFHYDYPFLKPAVTQNNLFTTATAYKTFKKSIPEESWDSKHILLPVVSVYH